MEFIYLGIGLAVGAGAGLLIGRLSGKAAAVAAETENRLGREARSKLEAEIAALKEEQGTLTQKFQDEFKNIANAVVNNTNVNINKINQILP